MARDAVTGIHEAMETTVIDFLCVEFEYLIKCVIAGQSILCECFLLLLLFQAWNGIPCLVWYHSMGSILCLCDICAYRAACFVAHAASAVIVHSCAYPFP
jgi:hypothetical protein